MVRARIDAASVRGEPEIHRGQRHRRRLRGKLVGQPVGSLQGVSVSKDHGLTWSPQEPLPASAALGDQIAVHDGVLASAVAQEIVGGVSLATTNPTFYVSFDNGQTWISRPVTGSHGNPVAPPTGSLVPNVATVADQGTTDPIPWVAADPTHFGRFAVMVPAGNDLDVYVTDDSGQPVDRPCGDHGAERVQTVDRVQARPGSWEWCGGPPPRSLPGARQR